LKVELVRDVRRLSSLVSAMLDLARIQNHAIEKRPIDLAVVTRDVHFGQYRPAGTGLSPTGVA
jgi:hypothetical protein